VNGSISSTSKFVQLMLMWKTDSIMASHLVEHRGSIALACRATGPAPAWHETTTSKERDAQSAILNQDSVAAGESAPHPASRRVLPALLTNILNTL
jgi:hypothetical protein